MWSMINIIALICLSINTSQSASVINPVADPPCPPEADILPCVCSLDANSTMSMDCSNATSEAELRNVFNRQFDSNDFDSLAINQEGFDSGLTSLTSGVFGDVTFRSIVIQYVETLSNVEFEVFDKMQDRLEFLYIIFGGLTELDLDFSLYTVLDNIAFSFNLLTSFNCNSDTIQQLFLDGNFLNENTFSTTAPKLTTLLLNNNTFTEVPDYSGYPYLYRAFLMRNFLTSLPSNTFCGELTTGMDEASASINNLTSASIASDSICAAPGARIYLHHNQITTLDGTLFAPIADNVIDQGLSVEANPLTCGCDIAWIFDNDRVRKFTDTASCADGRLIINLNPADYVGC